MSNEYTFNMYSWKIGTYLIEHFPGRTSGILAQINLKEEEGGKSRSADAFFTRNFPLPETTVTATSASLYFPYESLVPIMETLREEKPCYFFVMGGEYNVYISTSSEPVGEDEGAR